MSSRISPLCELNFIKNLSKDLIKFVYYPLGQNFENDFSHFHIIKEKRKFKKHIYKMICQETNKIIMYFVETSSFCSKKKTISIYLNYTYINLQHHLISDLENLVNEFVGINFNNTAKNGILIGVVEADSIFKNFALNTTISKLYKTLKQKTLYLATQERTEKRKISGIKEWFKNCVCSDIKQTKVFLNTLDTNELISLIGKEPIWNDGVNAYVLNFHGLVKEASVKNSISVDKDGNELFIFGKVSKNLYSLNIKTPISLIQGMCMAITCIYK
tara:strand:- start:23 stop:841 length:819 start_codon:yes stop_codon:yes gene_type:complete